MNCSCPGSIASVGWYAYEVLSDLACTPSHQIHWATLLSSSVIQLVYPHKVLLPCFKGETKELQVDENTENVWIKERRKQMPVGKQE